MKVNIFYSWQSDLPNVKNRNLIEACLKKSIRLLGNEINEVSENSIESDSRNDIGTPGLAESIFEKIEMCDILVADLSIINADKDILHSSKIFICIDSSAEYMVQQGKAINPQNSEDSYLLLKPIEDSKAVVIAGGSFNNVSPRTMTNAFKLMDEAVPVFAHHINNIIVLVNDWIAIIGKY